MRKAPAYRSCSNGETIDISHMGAPPAQLYSGELTAQQKRQLREEWAARHDPFVAHYKNYTYGFSDSVYRSFERHNEGRPPLTQARLGTNRLTYLPIAIAAATAIFLICLFL